MIEKPESYTNILGSQFIHELMDPEKAALIIGEDIWTKHEIASDLGIVQTKACGILTSICKTLKVRNTKDLFEKTSPYTFTEFPAGVTTLYVMFAAFTAKGLDPNEWYNGGNEEKAIVSFLGLKHRELVAARRTREDEKKRQRANRSKQHRQDVNRILHTSP